MCLDRGNGRLACINTLAPIRLASGHKLRLLRQLDSAYSWQSLDDRRFCSRCRREFKGRHIDIVGGTREHGRLRLICPTENCQATAADWISLPQRAGVTATTQRPTLNKSALRQLRRAVTVSRQTPEPTRGKLAQFVQMLRAIA